MKVKNDMKIQIPDEVFSVKKFECTVESNINVATFIKDLTLRLPDGLDMDFRAGGYIQIDIPEFESLPYSSFSIEDEFKPAWERFGLFQLACTNDEDTFRAYSMANILKKRALLS